MRDVRDSQLLEPEKENTGNLIACFSQISLKYWRISQLRKEYYCKFNKDNISFAELQMLKKIHSPNIDGSIA